MENYVAEAERRGYLTIKDSSITYYCKRNYKTNYNDPEEKVRAETYSWLIIERSYSPTRINLEVNVPRRTPNDYADIVVYEDEQCQIPWLVIENKKENCTQREIGQGIEQGFGNANSLRAKYVLFDNNHESILFDLTNYPQTERNLNRLGNRETIQASYGIPSQFLLIAQGITDIRIVNASELETKVRRVHGLIWAGGKRDPLRSFDEWSKLLFAKIYDERHTPNGSPRKFQCGVGETATQVANRIRKLYILARSSDPSIFTDENINLPDVKIKDIVQVIQEVGLSLIPIDGLGHAFEHFFGSIFRGELGQYFTRRELVRFIVAMVNPTDADIVIDPTCGSGGFLLETLLQVWHYIDANYAGQPDLERRKFDFARNNLFGIEIHDILGRVCQTNLLLHKDGHTNIETDRSCLDSEFNHPRIKSNGTTFTLAIGNPPFGDAIKPSDNDVLGNNEITNFEMGLNVRQAKSELVILERAFEFLQPEGKLAMVIPDGVLNNPGEASQCPAFRRYLLRNAIINAIISLPDHAFRKSGAQNKTSIIFATKFNNQQKESFERRYIEEMERTSTGGIDTIQIMGTEDEISEEDDDVNLSSQALINSKIQKLSLETIISEFDYPIFIAEAEEIGYSPSGITVSGNDLYSMVEESPNRSNVNTILGQYKLFKFDPNAYAGSDKPQCMRINASNMFNAHITNRMDPKFHLFERERLTTPPSGLKLIKLGDVLTRREEKIIPSEEPDREFKALTLSQEGNLSLREAGIGKNPPAWFGQYFSSGSRWFLAKSNDLIYSQIDLWKGCVAIIPDDFDGAIVTQEFPVFEIDTNQLDPYYLKLVLRSRYFQRAIRAITTGHSNRRRTQSADFLNLTIFAPDEINTQKILSETIKNAELTILEKQEFYRLLLSKIDHLVVGEINAEDIMKS